MKIKDHIFIPVSDPSALAIQDYGIGLLEHQPWAQLAQVLDILHNVSRVTHRLVSPKPSFIEGIESAHVEATRNINDRAGLVGL